MAMAWVWTGIVAFSVIYGIISGNISLVGAAALEGAGEAVKLCISICGVTCLWTGIMEVMSQAGLTHKLARVLRPVLRRLFPKSFADKETGEAISANVSANLLGLGNAATPMGIKAAERLANGSDTASDELCTLVVINTASIQLIPATIAAVRAANGSAAPFDILPAVWITSAASLIVGIAAAKIMKRLWRN